MPSQDLDGQPLSKHQRNDIYVQIDAAGNPVKDFELVTYPSAGITAIRHPATGSFFSISTIQPGDAVLFLNPVRMMTEQYGYFIKSQVGAGKTKEEHFVEEWRPLCLPWRHVVSRIGRWAAGVRRLQEQLDAYEATPDLWEQLSQNKEFLVGQPGENLDNTPFTPDEQVAITAQIKQIKDYITTAHELTAEQNSDMEARFSHAEEASRRMGRKDWITLFNGAVLSLILADTITPDTAQHIILMAIHGLGHLFGLGGPPPHLPPG